MPAASAFSTISVTASALVMVYRTTQTALTSSKERTGFTDGPTAPGLPDAAFRRGREAAASGWVVLGVGRWGPTSVHPAASSTSASATFGAKADLIGAP